MARPYNAMALKNASNLSLSMTPQLQQAIRLLQLSTLEVRAEITHMLERNPLLEEVGDNSFGVQSLDALIEAQNAADNVYDPFDNDHSVANADISLANDVICSADGRLAHDKLSAIDATGSTLSAVDKSSPFDEYHATQVRRAKDLNLENDNVYAGASSESLQAHLTWQLNCSPLSGADRAIAEAIIDGIADNGYLNESLDDILHFVKERYPEVTYDDVLTVLKIIEHYDPLGVGSRSVQEYLLIQLNELSDNTPHLSLARRILTDYLPQLTHRDFRTLCQRLTIKEATLKEVLKLITSLNQRPGQGVLKDKSDFIIPDVLMVKNEAHEYQVILNPHNQLPRLRLNQRYLALAQQVQNERDKAYLQNSKQEANYFIKALENRATTILTVAQCIMRKQQAFLTDGESAMQPLILSDIASELSLHESTVSRATTGKYIQTPRGTYELKFFFSSHVSTEDGGTASATAIRAHIKKLIAKENPRKPLSDAAIADKLQAQGFNVARRTIAKYRESLNIVASSQRKRLI